VEGLARNLWREPRERPVGDLLPDLGARIARGREAFVSEQFDEARSAVQLVIADVQVLKQRRASPADLARLDLLYAAALTLLGRSIQALDGSEPVQPLFEQAVAAFERGLAQAGGQDYSDFGIAQFLAGDAEGAAGPLQHAVELGAASLETYIYLGRSRQVVAEHAEAAGDTAAAAASYREAALALVWGEAIGEAQPIFAHIVELHPDDAQALADNGEALRMLGRYEEAIESMQRAVVLDPDNVQARACLGAVQFALGDLQGGLANLEHAVERDPENHFALMWTALTLRDLGRTDDAAALLRRSITLDPDNAEPYAELAETLGAGERYDEALQVSDQALARWPAAIWALAHRVRALASLDRNEEALVTLDRALTLAPDDLNLLDYKWRLLHALARDDEAITVLQHMLALDPSQTAATLALADLLDVLERRDEALALLDPLVQAATPNFDALMQQAGILRRMGRSAEALPVIDRVLACEPNNSTALYERGLNCVMLDRNDEAVAAFDRALKLDPKNVDILLYQASALRSLGRFGEALATIDRALEIEPKNIDNLRTRGYVLLDLNQPQQALKTFTRAVDIAPDDPWLLADLGLTKKLLNDHVAARSVLRQALDKQPDNQWALSVYADVLCDIGAFEKAIEVLDRISQPDWQTWATRGWALENLKHGEEAAGAYRAALDQGLGYPEALHVHKGLGDALQLCGDPRAADEYRWVIAQAQEHTGEVNADLFATLGWCRYQLGHYDEAIRLYREALALYQDKISTQFDLALALLCSGRYGLAQGEYAKGFELIQSRDVLRQRGLLFIARDDLEEALRAWPALETAVEVQALRAQLRDAYDTAAAMARAEHGVAEVEAERL
jgi:tetratricopeptide (TPR) repeat protein